jgi:hypothetical protein
MINNSLEWPAYEKNLLNKTMTLSHGFQVRRMIRNIRPEVTLLSKAEVEKRRGRNHATDDILKRINDDIEMVEQYLLVAALIG